MFNIRLAGAHLYDKFLFTLRSLGMSLMVSCFSLLLFFSHYMLWMRSGNELKLFLKIFLPTFGLINTTLSYAKHFRYKLKSLRVPSRTDKIFKKNKHGSYFEVSATQPSSVTLM